MKRKIIIARIDENTFNRLVELARVEKISKSDIVRKAIDFYLESAEAKVKDFSQLFSILNEIKKENARLRLKLNILSKQVDSLIKSREDENK